jgi:cysteinyl-tRNA synthetase
VYNNLHIGNLSAFIYADTLRRALTTNGYLVTHVMNITDVDDKTIRDSKRDYPDDDPRVALTKLTEKYTDVFKTDLAATGNDLDALTFISAVQTIPEMVALTQRLLDNKIAYVADDGVYFSITKYYQARYTYGVLQRVETQQSKARVANDEYDKDAASDFALWKRSTESEPSWPATFSEDLIETVMPGRPGWHIECSAMSEKLLGVPFDIHTGGIDLKFPHHENEIAQTCGAGASKLANYFVHNNHILVDGKKMAKSDNNFFTLRDVEEKGFSPQAFRLLVLESHYHSESNFSWDILTAANNRLKNWQAIADLRWQLPHDDNETIVTDIKDALSDNINTPGALKSIDMYFDAIEKSGKAPSPVVLKSILDTLGIDLHKVDISKDQKKILTTRQASRSSKDWTKSDESRDELLNQGIIVRDASSGQIWSRV